MQLLGREARKVKPTGFPRVEPTWQVPERVVKTPAVPGPCRAAKCCLVAFIGVKHQLQLRCALQQVAQGLLAVAGMCKQRHGIQVVQQSFDTLPLIPETNIFNLGL